MSSKHPSWFGVGMSILVLLVALALPTGSAQARNPDLSYWTSNVSESDQPAELGEQDFAPEIAVVGATVHVMWITRNADWSGHKLFYRRSTDNGATWEPKKLLFQSDDMVTDNAYRRMAVSGNTVHIAFSHYEGSWYGVLTYIRSTDNGATFDGSRNLFTAASVYHVYDIYVSAEGKNAIIGFRSQCNYCINNAYILKISNDNGANFAERTAYSTTTGSSWKVSDMQVVGNNIYVLYTDSYYYYGIQYSRLYVASSSDGGINFNSAKISVPSKNGEDKTYPLQDEHYVPKLAGVGNTVSVIWSGLDADDVHTIFYRRSINAGATWEAVQSLTAGTPAQGKAFQAGLETLATKGDYVYTLFVTTATNINLRRSTNGGASFSNVQELTTTTPYTNQGWWPVIKTDPTDASGASVYALWTYPTYVYSRDGGATFTKPALIIPYFSLGGAYASAATRPQMVIGEDGKLHYAVMAHYYSNDLCGGYCDDDIIYRGVTESPAPSVNNQALKVDSIDSNRYDNMQVPASDWLDFTSQLTAEVWVKSYAGGVTTGTTSVIKPIFHNQTTGKSNFAYALQTWDRYGQRQAQAQIRTGDGEFSVNPSSATEGLVPDGVWTHLAMTYNAAGGANNLKLYMNGRLIATATATGNLATKDGLFFAGRYGIWELDELRLWGRVRTQAEIAGALHKTLASNEPGLNAYYNFDGTTRDITGHGNDGILMYKEAFVPSSIEPPKTEDVTGDGVVNALDVVAVINAVLGIQPLPAADVNGDGATNALDVVAVINAVLGL